MSIVPYVNRCRILAIDPGTTSTGFAVVDYDLVDQRIHVPFAQTFHRKDILKAKPWMAEVYGDRQTAVHGYGEIMRWLLHTWEPTDVISEAAYLARMINAFRALTEIATALRTEVMNWDVTVPYHTIEPSPVKRNMKVSGKSSDKEEMLIALKQRSDVTYPVPNFLDALDEHSIDAICVALYRIDTELKA